MGLVDELLGSRVCIDTAPFIYFIEKDAKYLSIVHPFKTKNESLAEKYREILLYADGLTTFEIVHEVSELSSKLRAKYSIRTPDAIQIAVGIIYGADTFLTNDSNLKKVSDIKVMILEDFLKK